MGNAFSAISGQIGKTFAIGALLPATVFVLLWQLFLAPMAPLELRVLPIIRSIDSQWRLGLVIAMSTVLATLLYVLNGSILRFYQGYQWQRGVIGSWLVKRHRNELEALEAERSTLDPLRGKTEDDPGLFGKVMGRYLSVTLPLLHDFPKSESVLPTRLGNTIRSFENYPQRQYRIAAVTLWPRFVPKLTKEHAAMIDDAKSAVDLVLNLSCLSFLTLLATFVLGIAFPIPFASGRLLAGWLLRMAVFLGLGFGFYRASISLADNWGDSVRAAFDLHRRAVLHDLGFEQVPNTLDEETDLWEAISQQLVYGEVVTTDPWRYRDRTPAPQALQPSNEKLVLSRGVTIANGKRTVTVQIRNVGKESADTSLHETLDAGHEYIWSSATLNGNVVTPADPLVFEIKSIEPDVPAVITYATTMPARSAQGS